MFQTEFSKKRRAENAAWPVDFRSALSSDQVVSVGLLRWEEHCLECAAPQCFTTCALHSPRRDGLCARFYNGIYRNRHVRGLLDYGAEIRFKRWAKLEAPLKYGMVTLDGYLLTARRIAQLQSWFQALDRLLAPLITGRRSAIIHLWLREKMLRKAAARHGDSTALPTALVVEAFNPDVSPVRLNLEVMQHGTARFRDVLTFAPGLSTHQVPFAKLHLELTQFSETDRISLYPENDVEARLVFTWVHLVTFAAKSSPAIPTTSSLPAAKVKCVVWDLDNTVWSGILAEDGEAGLKLRPGVADVIASLDARGILLSVSSKNDHAAAWGALERFGLAGYFLHPRINWQPKSLNLRAIADELNLGLDSFAFIDDSPSERGEIGAELPQVRVYTENMATELLGLPEFDVPVTEESRRRREMYVTESARKREAGEFAGDADVFLRGTQLCAELFSPASDGERLRCFELLQRTNQLNISGRRYSEQEFRDLAFAKDWVVMAITCGDRFGSYGLVGCMTVRRVKSAVVVEDFVLSCRVASKRIEQAIFARLAAELARLGCDKVYASFSPTARNGLMRDVLRAIGFSETPQPAPGALVLFTHQPIPAADVASVSRCEVDFTRLAQPQ